MSSNPPVSKGLEKVIALRRDNAPRTVTIALTMRATLVTPGTASRAFDVFACFVEASHFDDGKVTVASSTSENHEEYGLLVETWEASFPRLPPEAFATVARLFASSVPGAERFEIREHAPEHALTVCRFELDGDATILEVPWQIAFVAAVDPAVRIVFADSLRSAAAERVSAAVRTWADVLALGGFTGPAGRPGSTGTLVELERVGEYELLARLRAIACGYDAWEALFEVLAVVHEHGSIERVEVRGSVAP